jgi:hypothetical protein
LFGDAFVNQTSFLIATGYNFVGARGDINVWSPRVESSDEYTTAQIWLKNGLGDIETLEAGWMVSSLIETINNQNFHVIFVRETIINLFIYLLLFFFRSTQSYLVMQNPGYLDVGP